LPANLAPVVEPLVVDGAGSVNPRDEVRVDAAVSDPEGGPVTVRWALRRESGEYNTGGDFRPMLPDIDDAIVRHDSEGVVVRMPEFPGAYRLYLYAYDDAGKAAMANVPLRVEGEVRTPLPFDVYRDGFEGMPWAPSGWMGNIAALTLDGNWTDNPQQGDACIRMRYDGEFGWVGVAWQHPPNNWGDRDGGFDLTGAGHLELWARGESGGERLKFGVGLIGGDRPHPDSGIAALDDVVLMPEWRRYRIPLRGLDLSSLKTGVVVTLRGRTSPLTVYLDGIRFVR
jgi:hypothetical protein